jgi:hypothetical protein
MLGSGIFCSAIVAWIIDTQNMKENRRRQEEHTHFILRSVRRNMISLLKCELKCLLSYYTQYILKQDIILDKKQFTICEIGNEVVRLLNEIKAAEIKRTASSNIITITLDDIKRSDSKLTHFVKESRVYYERLLDNLQLVLNESNIYLINELLNEDEIEFLDLLTWDIRDNLSLSTEQYLYNDIILDIKLNLFEKTDDIIAFLKLEDDTETIHYIK